MLQKLYIQEVFLSLVTGYYYSKIFLGMCICNLSVSGVLSYGKIGFKRDMQIFGKIEFLLKLK